MSFDRATLARRIGLSAATAILIIAGATLNVTGREGQATLLAATAGLLAVLAGALHRTWKFAIPLGIVALALSVVTPHFGVLTLAGVLLIGLGGVAGSIAYRDFTDAMH